MLVEFGNPAYCTCGARAVVHLCLPCATHTQHAARIRQGLARARALGHRPGRPRAISDTLLAEIRQALAGGMSKAEVCRVFHVKHSTLYETLARGK
jgi:DNA invertase Pin-like site-specific DNA recombinase